MFFLFLFTQVRILLHCQCACVSEIEIVFQALVAGAGKCQGTYSKKKGENYSSELN